MGGQSPTVAYQSPSKSRRHGRDSPRRSRGHLSDDACSGLGAGSKHIRAALRPPRTARPPPRPARRPARAHVHACLLRLSKISKSTQYRNHLRKDLRSTQTPENTVYTHAAIVQ